MKAVYNLHVREMTPLVAPRVMKSDLPITDTIANTVFEARETIKRIMCREDPRLLVVVGPCSIHDPAASFEYAEKLYRMHHELCDRLYIVMRTYFEKPRTTIGWRGLINDPHIDGTFDMVTGLKIARELLLRINSIGLPTATEMLDPFSPQYISDVVSLTAIGARTTESQTHRAMASGLSMPVGFKNSTEGNIQVAINAFISAQHPHSFLGIDEDGVSSVVRTRGNPDGFIILRGSRTGSNYDADAVNQVAQQMRSADLPPAIMIDCSHANAEGDYTRQEMVWNTVLEQHRENRDAVIGMMIESNLHEGNQSISSDTTQLRYGVSITDACVSWETTERMLYRAYESMSYMT